MRFVSGSGSTNVDLLFSGLPRIPNEGEELYAHDFSMQLGGGAPATMITLGRLGIPTRIQTGLGDDVFSGLAKQMFTQSRVTPLYVDSGLSLNVTVAMLTQSDRTFVSHSANTALSDTARQAIYDASRGASIVLMNNDCPDVYRQLKRDGSTLIFDNGWDDNLSLEKYRETLELADYYTPNRKEACKIAGTDDPHEAAIKLEEFFEHVIVKLDGDGCLVREHGKEQIIGSIPSYEFRDSTGAGDAFLAGLIYGIFHDYSFAESVLLGNITGGKCVTAVGCLTAHHDEKSLLATADEYRTLLTSS